MSAHLGQSSGFTIASFVTAMLRVWWSLICCHVMVILVMSKSGYLTCSSPQLSITPFSFLSGQYVLVWGRLIQYLASSCSLPLALGSPLGGACIGEKTAGFGIVSLLLQVLGLPSSDLSSYSLVIRTSTFAPYLQISTCCSMG